MMARAIGAAVAPPVPAWSESATATATSGRSAGAKAMNQVLLRPGTPVSAVPVLPATEMPGIWAATPVPDSHCQHHHRGQVGCRRRLDRRLPLLGLEALDHVPVGSDDALDELRLHDDAVVGDARGDERHLQRA